MESCGADVAVIVVWDIPHLGRGDITSRTPVAGIISHISLILHIVRTSRSKSTPCIDWNFVTKTKMSVPAFMSEGIDLVRFF